MAFSCDILASGTGFWTRPMGSWTAVILLDGWFFVEIAPGFLFPKDAHARGLDVPALFIGSEQFDVYQPAHLDAGWNIGEASKRLSRENKQVASSEYHVLPGSRHQNFTDVGLWMWEPLLRKSKMIGTCPYDETYLKILNLTLDFLHRITKQ